jgi:hypothetical protein
MLQKADIAAGERPPENERLPGDAHQIGTACKRSMPSKKNEETGTDPAPSVWNAPLPPAPVSMPHLPRADPAAVAWRSMAR